MTSAVGHTSFGMSLRMVSSLRFALPTLWSSNCTGGKYSLGSMRRCVRVEWRFCVSPPLFFLEDVSLGLVFAPPSL